MHNNSCTYFNQPTKGLIVVLIFYVIIAAVGMWAAWKHKTGEEWIFEQREKLPAGYYCSLLAQSLIQRILALLKSKSYRLESTRNVD